MLHSRNRAAGDCLRPLKSEPNGKRRRKSVRFPSPFCLLGGLPDDRRHSQLAFEATGSSWSFKRPHGFGSIDPTGAVVIQPSLQVSQGRRPRS